MYATIYELHIINCTIDTQSLDKFIAIPSFSNKINFHNISFNNLKIYQ